IFGGERQGGGDDRATFGQRAGSERPSFPGTVGGRDGAGGPRGGAVRRRAGEAGLRLTGRDAPGDEGLPGAADPQPGGVAAGPGGRRAGAARVRATAAGAAAFGG